MGFNLNIFSNNHHVAQKPLAVETPTIMDLKSGLTPGLLQDTLLSTRVLPRKLSRLCNYLASNAMFLSSVIPSNEVGRNLKCKPLTENWMREG